MAVCCAAAARLLPAASNVIYTASGTFAKYPVSGQDLFGLAGEPFSIRIVANADLQPVKHTQNWALYDNLVWEAEVYAFVREEIDRLAPDVASLSGEAPVVIVTAGGFASNDLGSVKCGG